MIVRIPLLLFLLLCCAELSAQRSAGNRVISADLPAGSMEQQLKVLEKAAGVFFSYDPSVLPVSVPGRSIERKRLRIVFDEVFAPAGIRYSLKGNDIVILSRDQRGVSTKEGFVIAGMVQQQSSRERLIGATVWDTRHNIAVLSNENGYFSLPYGRDSVFLVISYAGLSDQYDTFPGGRNYYRSYELSTETSRQPVVFVQDVLSFRSLTQGQTEGVTLNQARMRKLPFLFGETDVVKSLLYQSGVVSGSEGIFGMNVRGGSADQNLVLYDGVPVYNSSHILGIFSVFNDDVVKHIRFYKGAFPARHGGRLSAITEVHSREGNTHGLKGSFSTGLVASRISLEGPAFRQRGSWLIAARRSYVDFLARPVLDAIRSRRTDPDLRTTYFFFDINARFSYQVGKRGKLSAGFYAGEDATSVTGTSNVISDSLRFREKKVQGSSWGNSLGYIAYSAQLGRKGFVHAQAYYSGYRYQFDEKTEQTARFSGNTADRSVSAGYNFRSGIADRGAKFHAEWNLLPSVSVNGGGGYAEHRFRPGVRYYSSSINDSNSSTSFGDAVSITPEINQYASVRYNPAGKFDLQLGFRQALFLSDTRNFYNFQPRVQVGVPLGKRIWWRNSWNRMQQFFHLLSNPTVSLPTDLWVPSSDGIRPETAEMFSTSFNWSGENINISIEGFYKKMQNLLEYAENANYLRGGPDWNQYVVTGSGKARGAEFSLEKTGGNTTGWLSYTLQKNDRQFPDLNGGKIFPYRYDRRHNLSITVHHRFNKYFDMSAVWIYASGFAVTVPVEVYTVPTAWNPLQEVYVYGPRNGYRVRDNHRLDLSFNVTHSHRWGRHTLSFGLFNVYNRMNPFYLQPGYNDKGVRTLYQVSFLPVLPTFSLKLEFK